MHSLFKACRSTADSKLHDLHAWRGWFTALYGFDCFDQMQDDVFDLQILGQIHLAGSV